MDAIVDGPEKSAGSGFAQKARQIEPSWTRPAAGGCIHHRNRRTRTAVMRTRKIRLARTAQAALFREVKSAKGLCPLIPRQRPWLLDSVFWRARARYRAFARHLSESV